MLKGVSNQATAHGSSRVLKGLILVCALLPATSCGDQTSPGPEESRSFTGVWEGSVDGEGLRMELTEEPSGRLTGRVLILGAEETIILPIDEGSRPEPDSLYLDVSGPIRPPLGCSRFFTGRRIGDDRISGVSHVRCGHDPLTGKAWTVTRQS